jgi:hypothetical protein
VTSQPSLLEPPALLQPRYLSIDSFLLFFKAVDGSGDQFRIESGLLVEASSHCVRVYNSPHEPTRYLVVATATGTIVVVVFGQDSDLKRGCGVHDRPALENFLDADFTWRTADGAVKTRSEVLQEHRLRSRAQKIQSRDSSPMAIWPISS